MHVIYYVGQAQKSRSPGLVLIPVFKPEALTTSHNQLVTAFRLQSSLFPHEYHCLIDAQRMGLDSTDSGHRKCSQNTKIYTDLTWLQSS